MVLLRLYCWSLRTAEGNHYWISHCTYFKVTEPNRKRMAPFKMISPDDDDGSGDCNICSDDLKGDFGENAINCLYSVYNAYTVFTVYTG